MFGCEWLVLSCKNLSTSPYPIYIENASILNIYAVCPQVEQTPRCLAPIFSALHKRLCPFYMQTREGEIRQLTLIKRLHSASARPRLSSSE